jgi:tetratricopeptide (TPR) repeat protein
VCAALNGMSDAERAAWFKAAYGRALAALQRADPTTAERELREIQAAWPGEVNSLRVLGLAVLALGRKTEGIAILEQAVAAAPGFAHAHVDLAMAYRGEGLVHDAADALRRALAIDDRVHAHWCLFGDLLVAIGEYAEANVAYDRFVASDPKLKQLEHAGALLHAGSPPAAEKIFRQILREDQNHIGALCGLAAVSLGAGYPIDAERLLRHALKQSRHMPLIWRGLSQTLSEAGRPVEAEAAIRHALLVDPGAAGSWVLLGTLLAHTMRQAPALEAYERALDIDPLQVRVVLSKAHVLKTLGRRAEAEAVYRECLTLQPDFGEAYYSLADLKNYVFDDAEIDAMQRILDAGQAVAPGDAQPTPGMEPPETDLLVMDPQRVQLHFAMGRALEQRGQHPEAFVHYAAGNAARRRTAPFDVGAFERKSKRVAAFFSAEFFRTHADLGYAGGNAGGPPGSPIFIVGLPRSGSTLVEQVLASHSQVEGTMELPNILTFVRELEQLVRTGDAYPESLREAPPEYFAGLGARYLEETKIFRTDRPRFIDKMPNNFSHVGLIHSILPHATLIDVRRHPMDACWSAYKQYFAQGQAFTYDLESLGRYYRAYLQLMDHWDRVLPGKVLHLSYEALVSDTEDQVRRLLMHCGLEFEPATLRFYENKRAVRTASSEQVRLPIYHSSIGQWRPYAAQLEPLERSLGDSLQRFA